jgi:hypothetical protein
MVRQRRKHEENIFNLSLRSKVSKVSFSHEDNAIKEFIVTQLPAARLHAIEPITITLFFCCFCFGVIEQLIYFTRLIAKVAVCP